jgi:mono/diheme cytochrome c family protein
MKTWIKRIAVALAALAGTAILVAAGAIIYGDRKMQRVVEVPPYPLKVSTDVASIERGKYLFESRGCADCHGANGGGQLFIDDKKMGMRVAGPNITRSPSSAITGYTPADWERAIRHGLKRDGRPLMIMPSEDFARLTDVDTAALVAYIEQLPAQPDGAPILELPLIVRALYGVGKVRDAASKIDHALPPAQPVAEGVTVEHGAYVAQGCKGCHGATLAGGMIPGAPPDWPAAAKLTGEGSAMGRYANAQQFKSMMRNGKRPDGSTVSPVMPFAALSKMSDVDTDALYLYLVSDAGAKATKN